MIRRAWLRLRLRLAERAIDGPFNRAASLEIDKLLAALEAEREEV